MANLCVWRCWGRVEFGSRFVLTKISTKSLVAGKTAVSWAYIYSSIDPRAVVVEFQNENSLLVL
jgi:hypothetical protein